MKHIRKFDSQEEYETYRRRSDSLLENSVSLVGSKVNYYNTKALFYVEAIDDIVIKYVGSNLINYSYDGVTWVSQTADLSIPAGVKVYLEPTNNSSNLHYLKITGGTYNVGGAFKTSSGSYATWSGDCFADEEGLVSAENLILIGPAYSGSRKTGSTKGLFEGCINLVKAPRAISKAVTNSNGSPYSLVLAQTFKGCTNLLKGPAILVNLVTTSGYNANMSLREAFKGCSSLNEVDILLETIPNYFTLTPTDWLSGVAETGIITLNYTLINSTTFLNQLLPTIPTGWNIRYYDSTTGKYFIKFTIDEVEYIAEYGMTWGDWVSSEYNTIGLTYLYPYDSRKSPIYNQSEYLIFEGAKVTYVDAISTKVNSAYTLESSVYVQHIDGTLYTIDEWTSGEFSNDLANGVAITDETNGGIVVAKQNVPEVSSIVWGPTDVSVEGTSYAFGTGEANTDLIINTLGDSITIGSTTYNNYAAKAAKAYKFPNGKNGFLPSSAELALVRDNFELISRISYLIGGDNLNYNSGVYWSSSQASITTVVMLYTRTISLTSSLNTTKSSKGYVRPIILLETSTEETETTTES